MDSWELMQKYLPKALIRLSNINLDGPDFGQEKKILTKDIMIERIHKKNKFKMVINTRKKDCYMMMM